MPYGCTAEKAARGRPERQPGEQGKSGGGARCSGTVVGLRPRAPAGCFNAHPLSCVAWAQVRRLRIQLRLKGVTEEKEDILAQVGRGVGGCPCADTASVGCGSLRACQPAAMGGEEAAQSAVPDAAWVACPRIHGVLLLARTRECAGVSLTLWKAVLASHTCPKFDYPTSRPLHHHPSTPHPQQEEYPSSIPFFPPITEKTIKLYTRLYAVTVAGIIAFGGLVAPVLEVKLGVGGGCPRAQAFPLPDLVFVSTECAKLGAEAKRCAAASACILSASAWLQPEERHN